jgi:hypothetical protein
MKSAQERLDEAVTAAIEAAREVTGGTARSLSVDYQDSGLYPYRMTVPDETLPVIGLATSEAGSDATGSRSRPEPKTLRGSA